MEAVANKKEVPVKFIQKGISKGRILLIWDKKNQFHPIGIGQGLKIKINANIGTSCHYFDHELEIIKAKEAEKWGADTLMDLSTFGDIKKNRVKLIESVNVPVRIVPVYQAASEAISRSGTHLSMSEEDLFTIIMESIEEGCSMLTVHCGLNKKILRKLIKSKRIIKMISKGGGIIASWMKANDSGNPLYSTFEDLLDIVRKKDVILSFGASLRSGCVSDGENILAMEELAIIGGLVKKARKAGVQVKVEGPGHLAVNKIKPFIRKG